MSASRRITTLLSAAARTRSHQWAFVARAWLAAPSVELAMRSAGVARTLGWLDQLPRRDAGEHSRRPAVTIDDGARLVRWACKLQPLARNACLTQSLVQYALHRRDGVAARFVIGVRHVDEPAAAAARRPAADEAHVAAYGLDAHAWVQAPDGDSPATGFHELFQRDAQDPTQQDPTQQNPAQQDRRQQDRS